MRIYYIKHIWQHTSASDDFNKKTIEALTEADRIARDPNVKHYLDVEEALKELKK